MTQSEHTRVGHEAPATEVNQNNNDGLLHTAINIGGVIR